LDRSGHRGDVGRVSASGLARLTHGFRRIVQGWPPLMRDTPPPPTPGAAPSVLESRALLGEAREVIIRHGSEIYRLKLTRHDKLILTK